MGVINPCVRIWFYLGLAFENFLIKIKLDKQDKIEQ